MVRTSSRGKIIYSVDMMLSYVNVFKPKHVKVDVGSLIDHLNYPGWGDYGKGSKESDRYSAMDVMNNPNKKKYKADMARIRNANLSYPIIIADGDILDGIHRLSKAHLEGKKTIKAYVFTKDDMKKFIVDRNGDFDKVFRMEIHEFTTLFYKRFCQN